MKKLTYHSLRTIITISGIPWFTFVLPSLLGITTPKPGFEVFTEIVVIFITTIFVGTIVLSFGLILYNAMKETK